MPKRKSQFMRALEERRDEARRERLRHERESSLGSAEVADDNEPRPAKPEDKVLVERAPFLLPNRKNRRPYWK